VGESPVASVVERIFMFPGQSSRDTGMIRRLVALRPAGKARIDAASRVVGRDLFAHFTSEAPSMFDDNRDVQLGVLLANQLFLDAVTSAGATAERSLGLSLGEYNHLVHIGALDFEDAVRLVMARGDAYDRGPDGAMFSVFPLDRAAVEEVVARAAARGAIAIASDNSPLQQVIAGERAALEQARLILAEEQGVECMEIEPRIPMHTERFRGVAVAFRAALERAPWRRPRLPYHPNATGVPIATPEPEDFVTLLERHVHAPVRWRESIERLADAHPRASFCEVGPRAVLHNLLSPRWRRVRRYRTDDASNLDAHCRATIAAISRPDERPQPAGGP
jgi:[acyl-carrier-protein] S-malonyltransferase